MFDNLLFNKHLKIERMFVTFGAMLLAMCILLVSDGIHMYKASKTQLTDASILTTQTYTSLTNQPFTVDNVFRNANNTQTLVVLSGDLSKVSYLADTYQIFVSGKSSSTYSGGVYVFGELNKLCLFITNNEGFLPEVTQFVVRSTASTGQKMTMHKMYEGQSPSYASNDQMSFSVNLGASGVIEASFMGDAGLDINKMAVSAFFKNEDDAYRASLATLQANAVTSRNKLANIRQSLDGVDIAIPVLDDWASTDKIETRENTNSQYINTSYVIDTLADFDWENTSRLDSYATAANVSDVSMLCKENYTDPLLTDLQKGVTEWYRKDNSIITSPSSADKNLMDQYNAAILEYRQAKTAYQTEVAHMIITQQFYIDGATSYKSNVGTNVIQCID